MRPGLKHHQALLGETEKKKQVQVKKGRSEDLITKRNRALICRYYYYSRICKIKYADMLILLEAEFFLKAPSIAILFKSKADQVIDTFKSNPTLKELSKEFPLFIWNKNSSDAKTKQAN